jgi:hypothetical protein
MLTLLLLDMSKGTQHGVTICMFASFLKTYFVLQSNEFLTFIML